MLVPDQVVLDPTQILLETKNTKTLFMYCIPTHVHTTSIMGSSMKLEKNALSSTTQAYRKQLCNRVVRRLLGC